MGEEGKASIPQKCGICSYIPEGKTTLNFLKMNALSEHKSEDKNDHGKMA